MLLEELMHRYQFSNPDIHGIYKGNVEIEAKLLVYEYLKELYHSQNGIGANLGPSWRDFGEFVKNPSLETWKDLPSILYRMGYKLDDFKISDYSEFRTDNYDRLKNKKLP